MSRTFCFEMSGRGVSCETFRNYLRPQKKARSEERAFLSCNNQRVGAIWSCRLVQEHQLKVKGVTYQQCQQRTFYIASPNFQPLADAQWGLIVPPMQKALVVIFYTVWQLDGSNPLICSSTCSRSVGRSVFKVARVAPGGMWWVPPRFNTLQVGKSWTDSFF